MVIQSENFSFGTTSELYVEYMKRSEPFTMADEHYHDYYEIYYMLSGKRIYFIRDRTYSVEQGDLVFINKNELHKTMQTGEASHERVIIHLDDSMLQQHAAEHAAFLLTPFQQQGHIIRLPRQEQVAVEQVIRRMLTEIGQKSTGYELFPSHAVTELLLTAARYLQQHEPAPLHHDTPIHAKISEVIRYINAHIEEQLRLGTLAEQFFISPYYLSRMFKEMTGFTFSDYVVLTRIKEAQRLLRESKLSITDIAASVGFDNFSHFGKMFKKTTRLSPRDYRKQYI
ncbi:YesN/AraC family two-component response regulator [Paenibacillus castaneae]|uniref:AraC family transcriptional regulator n=1 Tax=Paenibacillus castaneae TaxID=474957 RepID=UPI000C9C20BF|nr:AraC family transcriptional regulator [Paenibacillus castaneae]NIK76205.1 YesN/AraC family two-component response regulator [Paenibacillus castaneae]